MINETKEKMGQMKLRGMLKAFEEQLSCQNMAGLSFEERLGFLIDREFLERENQKLTARLRQAKLVQSANIEDVDYQIPRGFDKSSILSFSQCKWISEKRNIIITALFLIMSYSTIAGLPLFIPDILSACGHLLARVLNVDLENPSLGFICIAFLIGE